ncbi:ROK family protein [Blastococcus atacamensis]|uniref:ROK family protein n=1 Tax=Blastococcus atacamensis TaxID=2070508 RepID=UPI000CEBABCF|nr:ROK family protein [Blastococcus atacamensis]
MPEDTFSRLRRDGAYVLGVDLGGTKVRAAVADSSGEVLAEMTSATDGRGGRHVVDQIAVLARSLVGTAGATTGRLVATAVGTPGVPDPRSGTLALSPNVDGLGSVSLRDELTDRLGHPVVLENDVTAAAIGERRAGCARDHEDFVFVAVGTGIGMGIVSGGRVLRGAHGAAGEIGYLPLGTDPFDPVNQRRGALEEATAGENIAARYRLATGATLSTREVFDLAAQGEPAAVSVIAELARYLALALTAVIAVLDPALVVLGGGVGSRPELLDPVRAALTDLGNALVEVRTSALGNRASVLGAIELAHRAARLESDWEDNS